MWTKLSCSVLHSDKLGVCKEIRRRGGKKKKLEVNIGVIPVSFGIDLWFWEKVKSFAKHEKQKYAMWFCQHA